MSRILAIAWTNAVRTTRDRLGLFFIIVLPIILIVVLGITYGGQGTIRIGVADLDRSPLSESLVGAIAPSDASRISIRQFDSAADLEEAVGRGAVGFGLAIARGFDAGLRAGGSADVEYVSSATAASSASRATVERAVAGLDALVRAARFSSARTGASFDDALATARSSRAAAAGVSVVVASVASADEAQPSGFSIGAQSQVILFMFLISLTGATELIITRQLGISRRMFSTPTSATQIVIGEGIGRLLLALFEGAFIVAASAVFFGVEWGDPAAATAIIVVFAFVSAGAALLIGILARNASQAGAIGPAAGMLFGLVGGTMVPPEVFPEIMRTLGHVTPHAWAMDAFRAVLFRGAGLTDILPDLAVLAAFALALLAVSGLRFRRLIASGAV